MAGRDKDKRVTGASRIKLPKFGKRDGKVNPVEEDGIGQSHSGNEPKEIKTVSKQVETKFTERELKKIKKIEEARMKAIQKDNKRMKKRMLRKQVRKDIVKTTSDSCATFCFVFVVGSVLLGGGTALIISGRENNVFDFIVVGATGIVCGIIFTATGISLFFKPLYDKHQERKLAEADSLAEQGEVPAQPYIDKEHAFKLKSQIHDDKRQKRRPSHVDLYYGDGTSFDNVNAMTTPRDESFTSYTDPPHLAVPNNERDSFKKKPVLLLDAKEPKSPEKAKCSINPDTSVKTEVASVSYMDETKDKHVSFSQEEAAVDTRGDDYEIDDLNDNTENKSKLEDDNLDKILKHASRNTIVIDYALLNDLESPPFTPKVAPSENGSDANISGVFHHHKISDAEHYATSQITSEIIQDDDQQNHLHLTEKLYEKHPEIVDKHKKRSKKHRKHSKKHISRHQSQPEITVPLDDSDREEAESIC